MNIKEELLESVENSGEKIVAMRIYVEDDCTYDYIESIEVSLPPNHTHQQLNDALDKLNYQIPHSRLVHGIVFLTNNLWLERYSCSGCGWWELKKTPTWDEVCNIKYFRSI